MGGFLGVAVMATAVVAVVRGGEDTASSEGARMAATSRQRPLAPLAPAHNPAEPDRRCAKSVIEDWYVDGDVDRHYRRACYAAALGLLPTSGLDHSSVYDDLRQAYGRDTLSNVVDEREGSFRTTGLGSTSTELTAALGAGASDGGFAPKGHLPAEVAVPLVLPNPPGVRERPRLLRFDDRAFLLARDRVYAMMIATNGARTQRGIAIGDRMAKVRRTYGKTSCYRAPGGERPGGGTLSYPVCRVKIAPMQYLAFGGDPIRSFTLFSRKAR